MGKRGRAGRAPSQRQLRVGELIRHELADLLARGQARQPRLDPLPLTVTEVRCTPDLKRCTAYIAHFGGAPDGDVMAALAAAAPRLRGQLARRLHLKFVPVLAFAGDTSFDQAARIDALLAPSHNRTAADGRETGE